ncbi:MAG: ABC transporter permease [Deltaproteobacteria bacterium]|nr:ABC transporter permease [Deltaproteobacteria bacterium]
MNTFRIAWRNLLRNMRRTVITLVAMTLSTAVLIVTYALMHGMIIDMEHSVTDITVGQVQVHQKNYRTERSFYDTIEDHRAILSRAHAEGIGASPRAFGFGLISSGTKSAGVQFWGIHPEQEHIVSNIPRDLLRGEFLPDGPGMNVVLGKKLARTLNAGTGTELIAVVQASDGSLGNEILHVTGILKGVGETLDRSLALMYISDFRDLFVMPEGYHEIVLNTRGAMTPEEVAATIKPAAGTNEVKTWRELMPSVSDMLNTFDATTVIFLSIFFLAAGLGVLNTMLMATFERIPEFGLLKAIGTSPWRIITDVAAEALVLGLISSLMGGVIGILLSLYFQYNPIDFTAFAEDFNTAGIVINAQWRAILTVQGIAKPVIVMWFVSLLAALYPAFKAARLDPVRALTHV